MIGDRPLRCDFVYATLCAAYDPSFVGGDREGDSLAAAFYWARTASRPDLPPLQVLGFEVSQLAPSFWQRALWQLDEHAAERGALNGSIGMLVEDLALSRAMQRQGLPARPIPDHLTKPDAWDYLCTSAAICRRSGEVVWTVAARRQAETEACAARTFRGGPRPDGDPTVPAFLYGVVCGLDEHAGMPPQPARVKIVQQSRR